MTITDLRPTDEIVELRARYRAFMEEHVYPNEPALDREDDEADALVERLRAAAKEQGLWAPHLPPEAGGSSGSFLVYAHLNEEIGRSLWGQLVFGCQAPDAGNAEILWLFGTDEQKERWLQPLVAGEVRSFFSMTEPEVPGSDPTTLRTRAVRDGDEWVIDGHKWFSSGAEGAAFGIVMAVTDPDADPHRRATQIIVPADTPGVEVVRAIPTMGHRGRGWTTHCEVRYTGVRVPVENTLGEEGDGFRIAQKRLGPGRIHHVMRWLGQMQRAFELMCTYALERESFGGPLAEKQTVQNWIADSAAEIQACRLMTLDAAHKIDQGDEARVEVSLIKFYAARVLHDVIDRAVQTHGARGLTDETPLAGMLAMARGARIYDGPDEVHRMVVARRILKSFAAGEPGASTSRPLRQPWSCLGLSLASPPRGAGLACRRRVSAGGRQGRTSPGRRSRPPGTSPAIRTARAFDDGNGQRARSAGSRRRPISSSAPATPPCSSSATSSTRTARTRSSSPRTTRLGAREVDHEARPGKPRVPDATARPATSGTSARRPATRRRGTTATTSAAGTSSR